MAFSDIIKIVTSYAGSWTGLLSNLIISILVGGLVFLIVAKIVGSKLKDTIHIPRVFLAVAIINFINLPIIWGLTTKTITSIPLASIIFPFMPFLVWLGAIKIAFSEMPISHALLMSVIGYMLSIFVVPTLIWSVRGILPL